MEERKVKKIDIKQKTLLMSPEEYFKKYEENRKEREYENKEQALLTEMIKADIYAIRERERFEEYKLGSVKGLVIFYVSFLLVGIILTLTGGLE